MPEEVVTTPFGKFLVDTRDIIGSTLKAGTLWDGPGFLQPIAIEHGCLGQPGVTILDVGANIGSFSVWLASKGAWRVVAFEPVAETMRLLKANLDLNKETCAERVLPVQMAGYDRTTSLHHGPVDFGNIGGTSLTPEPRAFMVPATRLDSFAWAFGDRVSLIKVDAQGCDGAAIMGLMQVIKRDHPAIVFEWEAELAEAHSWPLDGLINQLRLVGYSTREWPSHPNNYLATYQGSIKP